ncbi:hypothetical protein AHAS_Ahas15G0050900 [Arachis hypogaea]
MQRRLVWSHLWKLKIPHKILLFAWKILHNKLLVLLLIHQRFSFTLTTCLICKSAPESLMHYLFFCRDANLVWKKNPLASLISDHRCSFSSIGGEIRYYNLNFKKQAL